MPETSTRSVQAVAGEHAAASVTSGFRPAMAVAAGLSLLGAITALAVAARRDPVADLEPAGAARTPGTH